MLLITTEKRGNGYMDESEPGDESECILTHRVCHSENTVHCGSDPASPFSLWPDCTRSFELTHQNCANLSKYHRDNYLHLRIFETNRQIFQEAFFIFWRTSRFTFEQGDVLTKFLSCLSEAQRHNLKSIAICHRFRSFQSDHERHLAFAKAKSKWASYFRHQAGFPSLRSLKNVELHLNLYTAREGMDDLRTFRTRFKVFEPLRLLSLDEAAVTVFLFTRSGGFAMQLEDGEMITLTRSLRDRLLNPTITKQDIADTLQDEIEGLQYSLRGSESQVEAFLRGIAEIQTRAGQFQAQADQHQLKADEDRDELQRLQTVLSRSEPSEMGKEIQLRTGEYLELPGSDGGNVAES